MSSKKMFCLVFWRSEKTSSTIEEPEKLKSVSDGEESELVVRGISYKIVVVARSGKYNFCI